MKDLIEFYLKGYGYTNIDWYKGVQGLYILANSKYGSRMCIDLRQLVNEMLQDEVTPILIWE